MAMPLFGGAAPPGARAIVEAWAREWPDEPALEVPEGEDEGVAILCAGETTVMFGGLPVPVPGDEVREAAEMSWMLEGPTAPIVGHRSHAIVASTNEPGEAVRNATMVTRVIAAALRAGGGVGVYWGNSGQVHAGEMFADMARSMLEDGQLPVPLWVGLAISGASAESPLTLTTHGLRHFGHRELEVIDTRVGVGDLRMMAYDIAAYLLTNGPVLKDGHTFGRTETEKLRVEHTTSKFRKGEPVLRLHM